MKPDHALKSGESVNAEAVSSVLAQLTSGWKPASGASPEALTAARQALAHTLAAGKTAAEIHAVATPAMAARLAGVSPQN